MQERSPIFPLFPYLTKSQRVKLYGGKHNNNISEEQWFQHYTEKLMALRYTVFKWIDLPEYIPVEYLERVLLLTGSVAFIKDPKFGIQALSVGAVTGWTMYGEPERFNVLPLPINGGGTVADYPTREFQNGVDAVIIRNDPDTNDEMTTITMYARQLAKIRRQQAVNVDNQETTKIIAVDQNTELSMSDMDSEMRSGAVTVLRYKNTRDRKRGDDKPEDKAPLWEYNVPAEYVAGNLQELHDAIWGEALTRLGVNNVPVRKKERLVVSEAESNNDEVNMNSELQFEMRKRGCEAVAKVIGIDIDVERNGMPLFSEDNEVIENAGGEDDAGSVGDQ